MENLSLKDQIKIYKGAISKNICNFILKKFETANWSQHEWSSYHFTEPSPDIKTELDVAPLHPQCTLALKPIVLDCINDYGKDKIGFSVNGFTSFRANKYNIGTSMKIHADHISSIFDGNKKGIPILSIVCLLNGDFEGGEFKFFENYKVPLEEGDVMIFPSVFLFPHRVEKVTKGTRYSIVQWVF